MKKQIILIGVFLLILGLIGGYFYTYQKHRDIVNEKVTYNTSATDIFMEFQSNEAVATKKYLDKTIVVSGKIDSLDFNARYIVLDKKIIAIFLNEIPKGIKANSEVAIKGRVIGYDSLLEELKLDQCIIIK